MRWSEWDAVCSGLNNFAILRLHATNLNNLRTRSLWSIRRRILHEDVNFRVNTNLFQHRAERSIPAVELIVLVGLHAQVTLTSLGGLHIEVTELDPLELPIRGGRGALLSSRGTPTLPGDWCPLAL